MIPQDAIPNNPFSEDQALYIKAYYQGSLALYRIGEMLGHAKLLEFLNAVFANNRNPDFSAFDQKFAEMYPDQHADWLKAWRIQK
ncbi:MAG: hypothetical protein A2W80_15865 [Candidatus Riflebacteria bacterium GWC2_50_8]|nr:MAG: hypothetical protein A2W80_15865 [Candidatus Riflebacteria bacterium GWC2_50_8]